MHEKVHPSESNVDNYLTISLHDWTANQCQLPYSDGFGLWFTWQITNLFAFQVPGGHGGPGGAPFKLNIVDSIERIKEEFNFLQAQYHK